MYLVDLYILLEALENENPALLEHEKNWFNSVSFDNSGSILQGGSNSLQPFAVLCGILPFNGLTSAFAVLFLFWSQS